MRKKKTLRCRQMLRKLSDFIDGELDAADCRAIEAHMPGCRPCRVFIRTLRKTVRITERSGRRRVPGKARADLRRRLKACAKALKP